MSNIEYLYTNSFYISHTISQPIVHFALCTDIQRAARPSENHIQSKSGITTKKTTIAANAWRWWWRRKQLGWCWQWIRNTIRIVARPICCPATAFAADSGAKYWWKAKLVHHILMHYLQSMLD